MGFLVRREFADLNDSQCSIQNSSLATEEAIWLGVETSYSGERGYRMHLSREMAEKLIPLLQAFVDNGTLPE